MNLCDYLSDDFKWNLGDEQPSEENKKPADTNKNEKDNTTAPIKKIPQAGQTVVITLAIVGVIGIGVFFAVKYKKYNY